MARLIHVKKVPISNKMQQSDTEMGLNNFEYRHDRNQNVVGFSKDILILTAAGSVLSGDAQHVRTVTTFFFAQKSSWNFLLIHILCLLLIQSPTRICWS